MLTIFAIYLAGLLTLYLGSAFIERQIQNPQTTKLAKWGSIAASIVLTVAGLRAIEQNGGGTIVKLMFVAATLAVIAVNWRINTKVETHAS